MVKTHTNRRQRMEVKRQMREDEHASRIKHQEEHCFRCDLCSKVFKQRVQWVNHMKDLHHKTAQDAERGSKVNKIDAWLNGQRKKGKVGKSGRNKNRARSAELSAIVSAQAAAAATLAASTGMEADSDGEAPAQLPLRADRGAEGFREPAALATPCRPGMPDAPAAPQFFNIGTPPQAFTSTSLFGALPPLASFGMIPSSVASSAAQELAAAACVPVDDDDDDL
uniref:C2H2-type domain-containing protein n=1 Tax=Alexandrium andersonii TaxID=327968 RepID=A0A7S2I762_9DINO|mmetsp:Transcript_79535/g.177870  ORF Transcript_79535/g.177870 Transcript_79535/m.177870 type:complete len:224 (+) Transcript_79535:82-753(+)